MTKLELIDAIAHKRNMPLRSVIDVQSFKIDGVNIKPDVFYQIVNGKPVAQSDDNIAD